MSVASASASWSPVGPHILHKRLDGGAVQLIDVRTRGEFDSVHVASALNLPLENLATLLRDGEQGFSTDEPVYLLCQSGNRALRAADEFFAAGFNEVLVVQGGTQGWIDAGLPVVRGQRRVIGLERQVRVAAGSLVLLGTILGFTVAPAFFFVPAFVGAGLVFAGVTDWCGMALLLARAPWNR